MTQARFSPGLGRIGLCHAEIRRGQLRQHGTAFDLLAHIGLDRHNAACKSRINALGALFVPHQPGGQLHRHRLAGRSSCHAKQCQLRMTRRKTQLVALQDGGRWLGRRCGGFGAGADTGQQDEAEG